MCVEAAQPPKSSGLSVAMWFETLLAALRAAEDRWQRERLLRDVRRQLDDRSLADIGLIGIPGPTDTVVNVTVTLFGSPNLQRRR